MRINALYERITVAGAAQPPARLADRSCGGAAGAICLTDAAGDCSFDPGRAATAMDANDRTAALIVRNRELLAWAVRQPPQRLRSDRPRRREAVVISLRETVLSPTKSPSFKEEIARKRLVSLRRFGEVFSARIWRRAG